MEGQLRAVPLFAELTDEHLTQLAANSELISLDPGETLFREGDAGERAYVITAGGLEILKQTGEREMLLAVRQPGEVIGEMALLQDSPRTATARATGATQLVSIPRAEIESLMDNSPEAVRALFNVVLDRWQSTQGLLTQSERMAQLGTLTAGLAHELNNPAAAVNRAADQLRAAVADLVRAEQSLAERLDSTSSIRINELRKQLATEQGTIDRIDAITRADLEADVEEFLEEAGVTDAWTIAPGLVDAGLGDHVDTILAAAGQDFAELLHVFQTEHDVGSLLHQVEEGTRRLSAIVRALKSYSYLDQAPVQDVNIVVGIEDTILILNSKLTDIQVGREYADDVPNIEAYGSELNQVWTNLLDNAADAIHEANQTDGMITVRVFPKGDQVVIEVEDNGPGIPPETIPRVFDSFFTTKPPGSGTGLGLNISYTIIADKHRGAITVKSEPGSTVFTVELPTTIQT